VNDQTELRYATHLYKRAVQEYAAHHALSADERYLYEAIEQRLSNENAASPWFITCFTELPDDLSQWRAYGGGEGGYAIGFRSSDLNTHGVRDRAFLVNVSYDPGAHERMASAVADATFKFYRSGLSQRPGQQSAWTTEFLTQWGEAITFLAPVIKHPGFYAEREWRMVRQLRHEEQRKLEFTQKASLLARHLPLTFCAENVDPPNLPIEAIYVGPTGYLYLISDGHSTRMPMSSPCPATGRI
jgi:Protein of unknown function (DUF2971)